MSSPRDFDVLIGGGGMVGAAVAALLATDPRARNLRVALVESAPATLPLPEEPAELRVCALSRSSEQLLVNVGAWGFLRARRPAPYTRMRVWDAKDSPNGTRALSFDAATIGEPNLGHIAENRSVNAVLLSVALNHGVTLLRAPLRALQVEPDQATVTVGERELQVALVVAADGAQSELREWAGIAVENYPYPSSAVVARLACEQPHYSEARQRFLPSGPLALLPLADGSVSLVWSTSSQEADALIALSDEAFSAAVTQASDGVLGALQLLGARASFALSRNHATTYSVARVALVGDAAHTVHPLAGQGVNLGFLDAAVLVETILAARQRGENIGDLATLSRYSRARRADNLIVSAALHGIYRLFGTEQPTVSWARRWGLALVERSTLAKGHFMREALGLGAQMPVLLRPRQR